MKRQEKSPQKCQEEEEAKRYRIEQEAAFREDLSAIYQASLNNDTLATPGHVVTRNRGNYDIDDMLQHDSIMTRNNQDLSSNRMNGHVLQQNMFLEGVEENTRRPQSQRHANTGTVDEEDVDMNHGREWLSAPHTQRVPRIGDAYQASNLPHP